MKKNDIIVIIGILIFFSPFFIFDNVYNFYTSFNKEHGMIMSFVKFAILATFGELLGQRIRTGKYINKNFGILPRAIIWGFLGLTIKLAFIIFATGTPIFLEYMGIEKASEIIKNDFTYKKIIIAFFISFFMNLIYAPIMMTLHKITDTHIDNHNGKTKCLFIPIKFGKIMSSMNWKVQWDFVFKKTIPLFWIPAHTITFLLPTDFQVLFAALLGIALGVILAIASLKSKN